MHENRYSFQKSKNSYLNNMKTNSKEEKK